MEKVIYVKITGIIAEYNPLHAGHIHHMKEARRLTGADYLVAVMGGNFTQRGEAALFNKFVRAEMALRAGIDAVLELPCVYALRPAELFAQGGIGILNGIGADAVAFGCETDDISEICAALEALDRANGEDRESLLRALSCGEPYPAALSRAAAGGDKRLETLFKSPNFILAVEYLKAMRKLGARMDVCAVKRTSPYHAEAGDLFSASGIRQLISLGKPGEATKLLPESVAALYERELPDGTADTERAGALILDKLRHMDASAIESPDEAEGLLNRIRLSALKSASVNELLTLVKTRRYTLSRIRRLIMNAVLLLPPAPEKVPYLRLLGIRESALDLLRELKKRSHGALVTRASELLPYSEFSAECRATELWGLMTARDDYRRAGLECRQKFIKV